MPSPVSAAPSPTRSVVCEAIGSELCASQLTAINRDLEARLLELASDGDTRLADLTNAEEQMSQLRATFAEERRIMHERLEAEAADRMRQQEIASRMSSAHHETAEALKLKISSRLFRQSGAQRLSHIFLMFRDHVRQKRMYRKRCSRALAHLMRRQLAIPFRTWLEKNRSHIARRSRSALYEDRIGCPFACLRAPPRRSAERCCGGAWLTRPLTPP